MSKGGDPAFDRMNRLLHLTYDEDERGLVLKLCSFAEEVLGRLLLTYLRPGKSASDLVEGFNAPLGTLSARIKAAHAFGLLSNEQERDLDTARRIRNEFAHNWEECSFATAKVKDWSSTLSRSRIAARVPSNEKERFKDTLICILLELTALDHHLRTESLRAPVVAKHLMPQLHEGPRVDSAL